jgi:hypothetical protein
MGRWHSGAFKKYVRIPLLNLWNSNIASIM